MVGTKGRSGLNSPHFGDEDHCQPKGRPSSYTSEKASEIVALIRDGSSVAGVSKRRDMPSRVTITKWIYQNQEFRDAVLEAQRVRDALGLMTRKRRVSEEDLLIIWDDICALLADGCTVTEAAREAGVSLSTVYNWRERFPFFDEMVKGAMKNPLSKKEQPG